MDDRGILKPDTITILDAASFTIEREINGRTAEGMWNNPHNMWADFTLDTVYNGNWFGKWINKIDRDSDRILGSLTVGEAPTHIITIPTLDSAQIGVLTVPISADNNMVKVADGPGGLRKIDSEPTGKDKPPPHGHRLTCDDSDRNIVPNVFKGLGVAGSISIIDTLSGEVLREFEHDANDPAQADAQGAASLSIFVPQTASGRTVSAPSGSATRSVRRVQSPALNLPVIESDPAAH